MEEFLKYLIPQLVDQPDLVEISQKKENNTVYFTVKVGKEDIGKLIGKEGKVINSIRNLLKILAVKAKVKVILQIAETNK